MNTDGKPFQLTYLVADKNANTKVIAQNNIQQWKAIGINVALYKDRLTDFNTWAQIVLGNSGDWDITEGGWSLNQDPSPKLFIPTTPYNLGHFTSPELTKIIANIDSEKSFDTNYRKTQFNAFQEYMQREAAVIPLNFSIDWKPVNKRVIGWNNAASAYNNYGNLAVSATSPK
ncbi:hypothetical protein EQG49_01420 [Periweissella cryptocerci]|uniref:Solute-binding protein family 5 domain-containing protein n=1 Tax=Periweissella cryptocerci TaxID=2506420 RepID=A0A4P6YRD7_9LACO|nr:hypothetical protein [Periweissella cryptocerci]QBO35209.1 hypothetical protein EQG49_01420 [Periweissella cryptocerci]